MGELQNTKRKTRKKINPLKGIVNFVSANWKFFLFLFLTIIFTYKKAKNYFKPFKFEAVVDIYSKDSTGKPVNRIQFIHLDISTQDAFLPYEKVHVKAKLGILDSVTLEFATKTTKLIMLEGSSLTDNRINTNNVKLTPNPNMAADEVNKLFIETATRENGVILLQSTNQKNIFSGEAEVIYSRPGIHLLSLVYLGWPKKILEPVKIEIGSSVELLNKKTNDLLFIISVLGFLIALFTGFKIKPKKTD